MVTWNNLDKLASFEELKKVERVNLAEVMSGENGAERVKSYSVPMAEGLAYNYAAKQVNEDVLAALVKLAEEAQLSEKFEELYNGAVINTGENRLVLHQLTRGQLGNTVTADGVDKRAFYVEQQNRIAEFANKVHAGEITNAAGEKFTTVVQIGIGGSDLGPRAMYLALENWAKKNGCFKMEAKFISNVDPDDAAAVLNSIDVAHSIFVLVSKSGTTLETLTNESFVKDALKNAGLDASKHMIAVTSETSPLAKSDDYLAAFFMDDYIGGRYSSTSAVGGAVLSLAFGPDVFAQFLDGAAAEDQLSAEKDVLKNPEMLDALIGVCCGAGLRLAVYLKGKNAKKYRHGMEYGSARWGTQKDIEPFEDPVFANNVILTRTERLMMGNRPKNPANARNKNVLVVGGSGSGKTRFWLKPNLLQCHSSYVVTDPKGDIVIDCGQALLKNGYSIRIFNTINFRKSMHYNPFAYARHEVA